MIGLIGLVVVIIILLGYYLYNRSECTNDDPNPNIPAVQLQIYNIKVPNEYVGEIGMLYFYNNTFDILQKAVIDAYFIVRSPEGFQLTSANNKGVVKGCYADNVVMYNAINVPDGSKSVGVSLIPTVTGNVNVVFLLSGRGKLIAQGINPRKAIGGSYVPCPFSGSCFGPNTLVKTNNGSIKIEDINVGDVLENNNIVTATMILAVSSDVYDYEGIYVSGTHIVKEGTWKLVKDTEKAISTEYPHNKIYCLITSDHTIPIVNKFGEVIQFTDYTGIDVDFSQEILDKLNTKQV
jgi:hypothetical protein